MSEHDLFTQKVIRSISMEETTTANNVYEIKAPCGMLRFIY